MVAPRREANEKLRSFEDFEDFEEKAHMHYFGSIRRPVFVGRYACFSNSATALGLSSPQIGNYIFKVDPCWQSVVTLDKDHLGALHGYKYPKGFPMAEASIKVLKVVFEIL